MRRKISLLCFTCVMLLVGLAECRVRVQKFLKSQTVSDRTGYSKTLSTGSKIDCGATCVRENSCQKFLYTNDMCLMGESADGPGVMYKSYDKCPADRGYSLWIYDDMQLCLKYNSSRMMKAEATPICENDGRHVVLAENLAARLRIKDALTGLGVADKCPADRGYSLWIYDDMQLCLKYNSSRMMKAEATPICENDGGHVVLAENLAARLRIKDALTGFGVAGNIWLDGYDAASSPKQFLSWKGEPIEWIEWGADEPELTSGDICLSGRTSEGYKHRDVRCDKVRDVVCQKDMM